MKLEKRTGLILAVDVENEVAALRLISETYEHIDAVKIGYALLLPEGMHIVRLIRRLYPGLPIITDLKILDVPHTALIMTRHAIDAGADFVSLSGLCGSTVIRKCAEYARWRGGDVLIFVEFTHPDGLISPEQADKQAALAIDEQVLGIFAPGTKPERIRQLRKIIGTGPIIVSCGIGAQGPEPGTAITAGADFEIVGRRICTSPNPGKETITIADNLSAVIRKRKEE